MEFKKRYILLLFLLTGLSASQFYYLSPMVPKTEPKEKPVLFTKKVENKPKVETITLAEAISEEELKVHYGRLEEISLIDGTRIRGVVIEQTKEFLKIETPKKTFTIPKANIDTVEMIP
jgi:hypothetical protein